LKLSHVLQKTRCGLDFSTAIDFAALGITAETTTYALTFGFAAVFGFFVLGYVLGIAKGLIKKI